MIPAGSGPAGALPGPAATSVGPPVVCLGELMVDVVCRLSGPLEPGSDRPADTRLVGGGSAANTAAWLHAGGGRARLVARVGADLLGQWSRDRLPAPVAASVVVDDVAPTGTCVVLVGADGERTMIPDAGANARLSAGDVTAALATLAVPAAWLHVSAYSMFTGALDGALAGLAAARATGLPVSVAAASAAPLRAFGPDRFLDLIGTDVLLFANAAEAQVLTGRDDPAGAAELLAERVGRAVVTAGPEGAVWADGRSAVAGIPAAVEVVDSTGAGDAFAAGFLVEWRRTGDPDAALACGHRFAAQACTVVGGRPDGSALPLA